MSDSILETTKKLCSVPVDYDVFDIDIMTHINSVFTTLTQLGIGPTQGFMITDASAEWSDFLEDELRLNSVKSYMFMKVRLMFDPPATSFAIDALKAQITEAEWRINVFREEETWVPPVPTPSDP